MDARFEAGEKIHVQNVGGRSNTIPPKALSHCIYFKEESNMDDGIIYFS